MRGLGTLLSLFCLLSLNAHAGPFFTWKQIGNPKPTQLIRELPNGTERIEGTLYLESGAPPHLLSWLFKKNYTFEPSRQPILPSLGMLAGAITGGVLAFEPYATDATQVVMKLLGSFAIGGGAGYAIGSVLERLRPEYETATRLRFVEKGGKQRTIIVDDSLLRNTISRFESIFLAKYRTVDLNVQGRKAYRRLPIAKLRLMVTGSKGERLVLDPQLFPKDAITEQPHPNLASVDLKETNATEANPANFGKKRYLFVRHGTQFIPIQLIHRLDDGSVVARFANDGKTIRHYHIPQHEIWFSQSPYIGQDVTWSTLRQLPYRSYSSWEMNKHTSAITCQNSYDW